MSRTSVTRMEDIASSNTAILAYHVEGIERLIRGNKSEIPLGVSRAMSYFLRSAHICMTEELGLPTLRTNCELRRDTLIPSLSFFLESYQEAFPHKPLDLDGFERELRDTIYLTEGMDDLRLPLKKEARKRYLDLKKLYKKMSEKGESAREAKVLYGSQF